MLRLIIYFQVLYMVFRMKSERHKCCSKVLCRMHEMHVIVAWLTIMKGI